MNLSFKEKLKWEKITKKKVVNRGDDMRKWEKNDAENLEWKVLWLMFVEIKWENVLIIQVFSFFFIALWNLILFFLFRSLSMSMYINL